MKILLNPFFLLSVLCLIACNSLAIDNEAIDSELIELRSDESKRRYLESISADDRRVAKAKRVELKLKFGEESEEYQQVLRASISQNALNLRKVEKYIKMYGYPNRSALGEIAANTPWAVIHHAQGLEVRERNFKLLHEAYQAGNIDDGAFTFYLHRMLRMKNGKRLDFDGPYTAEEEITLLLSELGLAEM